MANNNEEEKPKTPQERLEELEREFAPIPPALIIARTEYPKWWRAFRTAPISLSGPGTQVVVSPSPKYRIYILTIVLTVSDETDIRFSFGLEVSTGPMHFGGADEPRGIVIAMGNSPAPCGTAGFRVSSDGVDASVGGFVTYYLGAE